MGPSAACMSASDVTDPGITGTVVRGEAVPAAFPAVSPRARLRVAVAARSPVVRAGSHPGHPPPVEGPALSIVTSPLRPYHATRSAAMRALGPVIAGVVLAAPWRLRPSPPVARSTWPPTAMTPPRARSPIPGDRSMPRSRSSAPGDKLYVRGGSYSFKGVNYTHARRHVHEPDPHLRLSRRAARVHGHVDTGGLPVLLGQQRVHHASWPDDPGWGPDHPTATGRACSALSTTRTTSGSSGTA